MGKAVLIIGIDGFIGKALAERLSHCGTSVIGTTRRKPSSGNIHLDLTEDLSDWAPPGNIAEAYLLAGVTSLEECRKNPDRSFRVNVEAISTLACKLIDQDTFVVFPSTSLVFDGLTAFQGVDDAANPQCEYGRLKAEAERRLLEQTGHVSVVRLSKVVGPGMPLFESWISALRKGESIRPFSDLRMSPIPVSFAAEAMRRIAEKRLTGVAHVSGAEDISYADAAFHIARCMGVPAGLVHPVTSAQAGVEIEHLPQHMTMDTSRLRKELSMDLPDIWRTLESLLE